ncbi:hypothetical protein B0H13DRAFT_1639911 [Mycena leptocephala]|nr:hypothetical protein B0H13DRAFT_1639911 [Mycena leptocephala]
MIRRSPTLISMSDLDVQEVRDVIAKQKTDSALMLKMKRMAENPQWITRTWRCSTSSRRATAIGRSEVSRAQPSYLAVIHYDLKRSCCGCWLE